MAQLALLSLALPSSSALRPSKSRRFTSLPSVAPRVSPRLLTASTISGSGLFQSLSGWMPISAPVPTALIGCDLVKISASGPIPTSRYCDHMPCGDQHLLEPLRFGRARPHRAQVAADHRDHRGAHRFGAARVAARLLLDHPFQHRGDEGDAGRLDRLQVAGRHQPGRVLDAGRAGAVAQHFVGAGDALALVRAHCGGGVGQVQQGAAGRAPGATGRTRRRA